MLVKFENRYGTVWIETRNVLWVKQAEKGTRVFFGDDLCVDVTEDPQTVVKKLNAASAK